MMPILNAGWFRRLVCGLAALGLAVTALGAQPPVAAQADEGEGLKVGFNTKFTEICLHQSKNIQYYATAHPDYKSDAGHPDLAPLVPVQPDLAPLVPIKPVQLTFKASHGKVFPQQEMMGPFTAFGQTITRWMTYTAKSEGEETLILEGKNNYGNSKAQMNFKVVKCKEKIRGSADMTQVTNKMSNELWKSMAALEMDGEAVVGEDSVKGSATASFFMLEQFESPVPGFLTCGQDPPWQGSGEVNVNGDSAALENGQLALNMDFDSMPINATLIHCEADTGSSWAQGSFPLPAWSLAEVNIQFDPLPIEGGSGVKTFTWGQYQLPMTISVVARAES